MPSIGEKGRLAPQNNFLEKLGKTFDGTSSSFVLGNAQEDLRFPIVYCSDGFSSLTGYSRNEIMGRCCDCSFLHGIDTASQETAKLFRSLTSCCELKTELKLYKKNGAPFQCLLDVMPIKNEAGNAVLFLVSHKEVDKENMSIEKSAERNFGESHLSAKNSVTKFRKFSRDVLFHLQRQYQGDRKDQGDRKVQLSEVKSTRFQGHSPGIVATGVTFVPQYKLEETKLPPLMLLHFGRARLIWDWLILFIVAYIAVTIPFMVAFEKHGRHKSLIFLDIIFEVVFIVDIIINFRTTYLDKASGRLISQPSKIALHYIRGWFVFDLLATTPFELLFLYKQSWGFIIALLKCGRLLRIFRVARRVGHYIEHTTALLILMMASFAILAHWLACIWYAIGTSEASKSNRIGWLNLLGEQMNCAHRNRTEADELSRGEAYISALYFIMTSLTTVGFGNIAPNTVAEKCFSVIILLLGAIVQSAIFGNMTAVIQKLYSARARFHAKASQIKQFVRLHRLDGDLRRRIEDWFITDWSFTKGVNTEEMLSSFPKELQADICLHLYHSFLSIPCFVNASRGCLRALSLRVNRGFFGPGEVMIKEKDAINCLFFVQRGTIEIVQRGCIVAILGSGDIFGEDISTMQNIRRANGDVRALMHTEVLFVTRDGLRDVLKSYPEFAQEFSSNLVLTFDLSNRKRLSELANKGNTSLHRIEEEAEDNNLAFNSNQDSGSECTVSDSDDNDSRTSHSNMPLWQRQLALGADKQIGLNFGGDTCSLGKRLPSLDSTSMVDMVNEDNDDRSSDESLPDKPTQKDDDVSVSFTFPLLADSCGDRQSSIRQKMNQESPKTQSRAQIRREVVGSSSEPHSRSETVVANHLEESCSRSSIMYLNPSFPFHDQELEVEAQMSPYNGWTSPPHLASSDDVDSGLAVRVRKFTKKAQKKLVDNSETSAMADLNGRGKCGWGRSSHDLGAYFGREASTTRSNPTRCDRTLSLDRATRNRKFKNSNKSFDFSNEDLSTYSQDGTNEFHFGVQRSGLNSQANLGSSGSHSVTSGSETNTNRKDMSDILKEANIDPGSFVPAVERSENRNSDSGISVTQLSPELTLNLKEVLDKYNSEVVNSERTCIRQLSEHENETSRSDESLRSKFCTGKPDAGLQLDSLIGGLAHDLQEFKLELRQVNTNLSNIDYEIESIRSSLAAITELVRDILDKKL